MSTPPQIQPTVIGYATPASLAAQNNEIQVEGPLIISGPTLTLPERCIYCDAPGEARYDRRYYWHNPAFFLLILFPGILIYALIALIVRKRGDISFSLCDVHHRRRRRNVLIVWLLVLGSIVAGIGGVVLAENRVIDRDVGTAISLISIPVLLASIIGGIVCVRLFVPKYIDQRMMKLKGAGPAFLRNLETTPVPQAVPLSLPPT